MVKKPKHYNHKKEMETTRSWVDKMQCWPMSRYERKMRFKNKTMEVFTWFIEGDDNHMHVETMALNKAIDIAIDCCFMEVIFETSNKNVTKMIKYEEDHRTMCGILGNNARKKMKRLEKKLGFVFLKEKQTA